LIECGVCKWDCAYIDRIEAENLDLLFELVKACNYLDLSSLLDLCCAKVASMVKGRSPDEIAKKFKLTESNSAVEQEAGMISGSSLPEAADSDFCHCKACGREWRVPDPPSGKCTGCSKSVDDGRLAQPWKAASAQAPGDLRREWIGKTEGVIDIPDEFKTAAIPQSFRSFTVRMAEWQASFATECSTLALQQMDPRTSMKMSYKHFQEADEDGSGILSLEQYINFSRMEHKEMCALLGFETPFEESLWAEGFSCQQFEGKGGITFVDMQIGTHMASRIVLESAR
jgi:hypothetical protein